MVGSIRITWEQVRKAESCPTLHLLTQNLHLNYITGNGNPLHCSCLENLRDGGAWWAAISGVAQGRTRLKRLAAAALNNKAAAADTDGVVDNEGDSRNNKNF